MNNGQSRIALNDNSQHQEFLCYSSTVAPDTVEVAARFLGNAKIDDLVQSFSNMKAQSTASPHHIQNLNNWFATCIENAIRKDGQNHKRNDEDLFVMLSKHQYPIATLLHRSKLI